MTTCDCTQPQDEPMKNLWTLLREWIAAKERTKLHRDLYRECVAMATEAEHKTQYGWVMDEKTSYRDYRTRMVRDTCTADRLAARMLVNTGRTVSVKDARKYLASFLLAQDLPHHHL